MSVEVMRAEDPISQHLKHNLESFFYILLYICMMYKALSTKRVQEDTMELGTGKFHPIVGLPSPFTHMMGAKWVSSIPGEFIRILSHPFYK